jgi:hypothetical protein
MGQTVSGGGGNGRIGHQESEKLERGILLTDVVVKKREIIVDVPRVIVNDVTYERPIIVDKEYERPVIKEVIEETIKYNPVDKETIRYVVKDIEVVHPILVDKEYERPIIKEQIYEKPIVEHKKIDVVTVNDLESVLLMSKAIVELTTQLKELKIRVDGIKDYKLVEKVITVPKIEYTTVKVERIEWVPVKREMPV